MGKSRKTKQAANQTQFGSDDDGCKAEVPVEFLTSDDFQVVQRKRHHSKKSPDDQEDKGLLPRSRSNSNRLADADEAQGCHSGFWSVRSQKSASESSTEAVDDTADCAASCKEGKVKKKSVHVISACDHAQENGSADCFSEVVCGLDTLCLNDGLEANVEYCEKDETLNFQNSNGLESGGGEKAESAKCLSEEVEELSVIILNAEPEEGGLVENGADVHVRNSGTNDINTAHGNKDIDKSNACESESCGSKSNSHKRKVKKTSEKQKKAGDDDASHNGDVRALTSSSSSDFSETHPVQEDEEGHEKKNEDPAKKDRKRPSKKQLAAIHDALKKAKEEEERRKQEEEIRRKLMEEAERQAREMLRMEQERKDRKKLKEKQKRERMKAEGRLLSKSQKKARARLAATLEAFRQQGVDVPQIGEKRPRGPRLGDKLSYRKRLDSSQSDTGVVCNKSERHKSESLSSQESSGKESLSDFPSSFDSKDSWDLNDIRAAEAVTTESEAGHFSCSEESDAIDEDRSAAGVFATRKVQDAVAAKLKNCLDKSNLAKLDTKTSVPAEKKDSVKLRSPVICVLGHVDTGKTKLLDFIRRTHVQDSEAGGITQQIGATMIPQDALKEKCKMVKDFSSFPIKVPGLLVIDTPGHESFRNLRSRGTSICDIAILVVDIMHGLQPQTLESINLLKMNKIPFVVALNKIDRIYDWKSMKDEDIESVISKQSPMALMEFKKRCQDVILQFANECLNAALFYENIDPRTFVSMVPTSAISGDGMGNLLSLITQLTQSLMHKQLVFSQELQATVLEVKVISGLGTTVDVILVNGRLQEGDTIVLAGYEGPIVTQIRSLLMPRPLKELRVKNSYIEYKIVEGAQGVKLTGKDLDRTIAGMPLFVAENQNKVDALKSDINDLLNQTVNSMKTSERGVYVQASTLGSLEALLDYLTSSSIPYFGVKIGPVVKKDVMKASIMLEHDALYATILAFDVKIERDAQELADSLGVKIFTANIIYHLLDDFVNYRDDVTKKRDEAKHHAVFPCILKVLSEHDRCSKDSIVLSVAVEAGTLREKTPLCVSTKGNLEVGVVSSIEGDHGPVVCAKEGQEARITIVAKEGDVPKVFGTHFDQEDYLVSRVTRQSIEVCKEYFKDELDHTDWHLMGELKKMLHLQV